MSNETVDKQTGEVIEVVEPTAVARFTGSVVAYNPDDPVSLYLNESVFNQLGKVAKMMAGSELVPAHLRGKPADCFLVCSQAIRWKMDPFAAAQHIYVARGKVGWEGKIVAAIVNSRLSKKLDYEYSGKENTPERTVTVTGTLRGEAKSRSVKGSIKDWSTGNEQWKSGDQMLAYRGAREWARRHMPEAVLGVYSDDEVREIAMRESEEVTDTTLDDLLNPARVTSSDDPAESMHVTAPGKVEAKPEAKEAAVAAKKKAAARKPAQEQKQPKPEPEPDLDAVFPKKDPEKKEPEKKVSAPAKKKDAVDDDEIDALFS